MQDGLAAEIATSPRMAAQRKQLDAAFGPSAQRPGRETHGLQMKAASKVIQLGKQYDSVFAKAQDDAEEKFDYTYASVSDNDYVAAADELIGEHLAAGFTGHDTKDVVVPKATPDKKGWGGAPGILYIPERTKGLNLMMGNNTFIPSLTHEAGHFALEGKGNKAGMQEAIGKIAAKAGIEAEKDEHADAKPKKADWIEESRADLTGVFLRMTRDGTKPPLDDYKNQLGDEPADGDHPPGNFRIKLIKEYLDTL